MGKKTVVGVSMLTFHIQFHRELRAVMERAAREAGIELVITSGEFNAGDQASHIVALARRPVDAIAITPCGSGSVGIAIDQANRARIPVFTVDIASTSPSSKVVSHVASDNLQGGRKAGELLARALSGQGGIIVVAHPGVSSVADRVRGFKEVISGYKGMRLIGEIPAWSDPRATSTAVIKQMLGRTTIAGIFCTNDEFAMGALAAVEGAGKAGKVVIVGYDGSDEVREAIRKGRIHADVVQRPDRIGELAIGAIRDHLAGRPVPPTIPVEVGVFTAAGLA